MLSLADVDISVYNTFFRLNIHYFDVCGRKLIVVVMVTVINGMTIELGAKCKKNIMTCGTMWKNNIHNNKAIGAVMVK